MKIVVTGATGLIGQALTKALFHAGHTVTILSRRPARAAVLFPVASVVPWDPSAEGAVVKEIDGSDVVINLAGEPLPEKRWNRRQKNRILESRVNATRTAACSIKNAGSKPAFLINASAIGYYASHHRNEQTESSPAGSGFLSGVCKASEAHAIRVQDFGVRVIRLRIGLVLGRGGGALQKMLPPFRLFAGGWLGDGNQWMSWIHLDDLVRLILFCIDQQNAAGAINAVSPQPVTNKAFSLVLAQVLHRPCWMPVPKQALRVLFGEMSDLLTESQKVIPKRAKELGFTFKYPDIRSALENLLR